VQQWDYKTNVLTGGRHAPLTRRGRWSGESAARPQRAHRPWVAFARSPESVRSGSATCAAAPMATWRWADRNRVLSWRGSDHTIDRGGADRSSTPVDRCAGESARGPE